MLNLQRNVPPVAVRRPVGPPRKYPFDNMKVGDFFFVPGKKRDSIRTYLGSEGSKRGMKIKSEQIFARETEEGWIPCGEHEDGATSGVGVWRTE